MSLRAVVLVQTLSLSVELYTGCGELPSLSFITEYDDTCFFAIFNSFDGLWLVLGSNCGLP